MVGESRRIQIGVGQQKLLNIPTPVIDGTASKCEMASIPFPTKTPLFLEMKLILLMFIIGVGMFFHSQNKIVLNRAVIMNFKIVSLFLLLSMLPVHLFSEGIANMKQEDLKTYQADVLKNYAKDVGLPDNYSFSNGRPVLPLPPVSAAIGGIMIIGAYPSADFQGGRVPGDNLKMPFDPTMYPNGINKSAVELDDKYLTPLGLSRDDCWITNLVKVFLFKKGHPQAHGKVKAVVVVEKETRSDFELYAKRSLHWIETEVTLAKPKLIITLGEEVAGVMTKTAGSRRVKLLDYVVRNINLKGHEYKIVHMAHPGQLMRENPKWLKIHADGIKALRPEIQEMLGK